MLSISKCRQLLGNEAENMSDSDIEGLRAEFYGLADVLTEMFLSSQKQTTANLSPSPVETEALT